MPLYGPPIGFEELLAQKYKLLEQEAASRQALQAAQANQIDVQAGLAPLLANSSIEKAQSDIGVDKARIGLLGAQTSALDFLGKPLGGLGADLLSRLRGGTGRRTTGTGTGALGLTTQFGTATKGPGGQTTYSLSVSDEDALKRARALRGF